MKTTGRVNGIISNIVIVKADGPVGQNEICHVYVGDTRMMAEVIKVVGDNAYVQVFDSTRGLKIGEFLENPAVKKLFSAGEGRIVRESFLTVIAGEVPSLEDVVKALIRQNVLPNKVYTSMKIIEGEELDDSLPVGKHSMTLEVEDEDGQKEYVALTVEVVQKETIEDPLTHTLTFWEKFCQFWIDLWKKIVAFFTGGN